MLEVFACHNPSLKKKKRKILVCKLISNEEIDALLPNFHCSIFKTANGLCKSCFFSPHHTLWPETDLYYVVT